MIFQSFLVVWCSQPSYRGKVFSGNFLTLTAIVISSFWKTYLKLIVILSAKKLEIPDNIILLFQPVRSVKFTRLRTGAFRATLLS
jgi:hypothetical protein